MWLVLSAMGLAASQEVGDLFMVLLPCGKSAELAPNLPKSDGFVSS